MPYGTIFSDAFQGSTANTAPVIYDGNSREIGTFCKSWSNYNSSTGAIRASFNLSSITIVNTTTTTGNFAINMLDANFSSCAGYGQTSYLQGHEIGTTKTVSSFSVLTFVMSSVSGDNRAAGYSNQYVSTSVFR